ncbi:kinase-like protein [Daldinia caldariorum]|uniref:kinase-like protein n=1 Tax=Daldinia caldariorum TaxID=326644 RepID=UPI002007564D|nr:kinase-like protein [Daldinia caldariorum]KAI1467132.1 kinase-like protein [Daldinia caldariorum]
MDPIGKISCWVAKDDSSEGCKSPEGFYISSFKNGEASHRRTERFLDVPLLPGRAITVGRDHHVNDISINHPNVSRNHFVIYSIIYELNDIQKQPHLVYVRDCNSLEGTYIDQKCIGNKKDGAAQGFYISRDVVIMVKPYWRFRVSLLYNTELKYPLNSVQLKESGLFRHQYLITDRTLGRGTFANVHLALDVKTGKQLACKIHDLDRISRMLTPSRDVLQRIKNETDILGKLRHPNLPTFIYAFRSEHTLYTFVELATGGDLFSMRLTRGIFDEKDCKFVVRQILNAMCYLHEGGIAHRDLKPENIFFATGPGIMGRVIVGDLGFAKSTSSGRMASRVGTDQYMAPEVEYGEAHDLAVDIWSLGMITVFLLAPDENAVPSNVMKINQAAINAWLETVFEDPSQQRMTNNCQNFIRSCLMFEPINRQRSPEAKNHAWFQQHPDEGPLKFLMKKNTEAWKPVHKIAPPVQELPDMEEASSMVYEEQEKTSYFSAPSTNLGK